MPTNSNPYGRNRSDRQQRAPSRLVNADALGEEIKFYPRRPRLKSALPGQAPHFATHAQGLFRIKSGGDVRDKAAAHVRTSTLCQSRLNAPHSALFSNTPVAGTRSLVMPSKNGRATTFVRVCISLR